MGRWGLILVTSLMAQIGYGQHEADVVMSIARWGSMSPLLVSPLAGPLPIHEPAPASPQKSRRRSAGARAGRHAAQL